MTDPIETSGETAVEKPKNDFVLNDEPEVSAEPTAETKEETAEAEPDHEGSDENKKKRGGFQKKIALRDQRIADLEAQLQTKTVAEQAMPKIIGKPVLDTFQTYDEYIEALTDWKADQVTERKLLDRDKKTNEQRQNQTKLDQAETYTERREEFKKEVTDFDETVGAYEGPFTEQMQHALLESEVGPQLAYHIAKNPEIGERLAKMTILQMNKEIGRLEARLEMKEPTAIKTTNAPPPISPVGKGKSSGTGYQEDMSYDDFKRLRRSGKL